MRLYGGIDLHSNNCVINLIDENDNVIIKKKIRNNIESNTSDKTGGLIL